jgi:2-keto-4-pentenoate hydratase
LTAATALRLLVFMPPTPFDIAASADWIAARRLAGLPLADMPAALKPVGEDAGYAVQAALRDRLVPHLGASIGWKVGATTQAMQALLNVPAPCAGEMHAGGLRRLGAAYSHAGFRRVGVECEIAMEIARPLGDAGLVDAQMAAAAVGRIFPAAEIVDDRYGDFRNFGVPALIADFFFHHGVVLGEPVADWHSIDLAAAIGTTRANGEVKVTGRGADVLGHPMRSLAWLANRLRALGRALEPGQIVMTGSLPLPYWASAGDRVEIEIAGLGAVRVDFD